MTQDMASLFAEAQAKYQAGDLADAADLFQNVLERDPKQPDALHMLGVIAYQLGQADAAEALLQQALHERSPFPDAAANLGTVLMALGRLEDAERILARAHMDAPDNAVIAFNYGNVLFDLKTFSQAQTAYETAVALQPDHAEAWCQLGISRREQNDLNGAADAYRQAIAARPGFNQAHYNLGNVHRDLGSLGQAETELRAALKIRPDYAMAWNSLGTLLGDMARSEEANEAFDKAVLYAPESTAYASNRLSAMQYVDGISGARLAEAHTEWYWLHIAPEIEACPPADIDRNPDRPLRIGFVSPDFGVHPVGFLSAPLFDHAGNEGLETVIFSTRPPSLDDDLSKRLRETASGWIDCAELDDDALDKTVRDAKIDILFDMSGHTSGNRLKVFARKPAPVQMSWIGYVGTTGLPAMDYILGDALQFPANAEALYAEKPLPLNDGYTCYAPPGNAPAVAPSPAMESGKITFGCLNNPAKVTPAVIETFAKILAGVADSVLLFRFRGWDDVAVRDSVVHAFKRLGIAENRLRFEGRGSHAEFLATYNKVDIALDTFPYSGGLTTCEALWMGVPTVTFPGSTFAGRHAASYLTTAGYAQLIATDRDDYVNRAIELAGDAGTLKGLRTSMRDQVAQSPLCDGERFARSFAKAMRTAWQSYCQNA